MTDGYLYCFSNESMPGLLKVGMTERTPEIRLNEANSPNTWRPPTPYKIEFAKKVLNPKQKETTLHNLLSQYTERTNPKREFFRISTDKIKLFFDLIDGDLLVKTLEKKEETQPTVIKCCNIIQYNSDPFNGKNVKTFTPYTKYTYEEIIQKAKDYKCQIIMV